MREIKFRAWDKENKAFMPSEGYAICDGDVMGLRYGNEMEDVLTDQIELMQYTGLKDMNGVDIYEGDLVKLHVVILSPDDNVGVVRYTPEYGYSLYFGSHRMARQEYWASGEKHTLEVIGNIHENIELLEAEK